jgi:hypothetical protein
MNIRKVALSGSGFRGCEIHFFQEETKEDGTVKIVLHKVYPKDPVHLGLVKLFKDLRPHLLNIVGITHADESITAMYINETHVDTVETHGDIVIIHGEREVFENKKIKLSTCKVEAADMYLHFDDVKEIIEKIHEETEAYMTGAVKVDEVEVALRYAEAGKAKGVTVEDLQALSPDKLKDWAHKLLENNFGMVVLGGEDIEVDGEMLSEAVEELKTDFEAELSEDIIIPTEEPKSKKKSKKDKVEKVLITDEHGNMSVAGSPEDNHNDLF